MLIRHNFATPVAMAVLGILLMAGVIFPGPAAAYRVTFEEDIHPIIQIRCLECHQPGGSGYEKSGLDMRTYESLMKGTKFGAVIVPGDAFISNLMVLIQGRADPELRMPFHRKRLTACEVNLFRRWINEGAKDN